MNNIIRNFNKILDIEDIIRYIFIDNKDINIVYPYNILYQNTYYRTLVYDKNNELTIIINSVIQNIKLTILCINDKKTFIYYINKYIKCINYICDLCILYEYTDIIIKEILYQILINIIYKYHLNLLYKLIIFEQNKDLHLLINNIFNECSNEYKIEKQEILINKIISYYDKDHIYIYFNNTNLLYNKLLSFNCYDDNFINNLKKLRLKNIYHQLYKNIDINHIIDSYIYIDDDQINYLIKNLDLYYTNMIMTLNFESKNEILNNKINDIIIIIYKLNIHIKSNLLDHFHNKIIEKIINESTIIYYTHMLDKYILNIYKSLCKSLNNDINKYHNDIYLKLYFLRNLDNTNICFEFLAEYYKCLQNRILNYNINNINRLESIYILEQYIISIIIDNLTLRFDKEKKYWSPKFFNIMKDIDHSIYYTKEFRKSKFTFIHADNIKFTKNISNYMILLNHTWTNLHPFLKSCYNINYPDKLKIYITSLEQHYKLSCPYKKLHIIHHLSVYTLNWKTSLNNIIIKCNLIQLAIILLFEKQNHFYFDSDINKILCDNITSDSINYISKVLKSLINSEILVYQNNRYEINKNIQHLKEINALKYFDIIYDLNNKIDNYHNSIIEADKEMIIDCHIMKFIKKEKSSNIDNIFNYVNNHIIINQNSLIIRINKLIENYYIEQIDDKIIYIE